MGLLSKKSENVEPDFYDMGDKLILFDNDKRTVELVPVTSVTADSVESIGRVIVPLSDVEVFVDGYSRVFTYRAPSHIIEETKKLAELEMSTVLQQLTVYKEKPADSPFDVKFLVMAGLLVVAIIAMAF